MPSEQPDLVILAAGMGTRYGGLKQLAPVGPAGEAILHYTIYDAKRAGFGRVVLVIRPELEAAFRERIVDPLGGTMDLTVAHQDPATGRRKPWGTAHALLAARELLDNAFGVCNADDFYGADAHRLIVEHLRAAPREGALVTYRLGDTLSSAGGVSRAVCEADVNGLLTRVVEVREIAARDGALEGEELDGTCRKLSPDVRISTNFWGLPLDCLGDLNRGFDLFRAGGPSGTDEYLLSTAVDGLIGSGGLRVRMLPTAARFLGITRVPDQGDVASGLRALVAEGAYPHDLVGALFRGEV